MRKRKNLILLHVLILSVFACSEPEQKENSDAKEIYLCSAEEINADKWKFTESSQKEIYFQNVETQSNTDAHTGKFSCKTFPGSPYAFTTEINKVKPDDYIEITAWRKSKNHGGVIALDGGTGFYNAGKFVIEKEADGWEKIFVEYHVPPNFYAGKFRMYAWNNSQDTVYFDDFQIIHRNRKKYPDYADVKGLQLHIDQIHLNRLAQKRLKAFETTVLMNSDEDYANAVLFDGNDFLNTSFRLKGDLVDHLQGDKWSFRLKLKKGFSWKGLRTFSIQNPSTRDFLSEWLAHKIFEHEDVLTTRYGFIPVSINKKSLGIYAWEEHFEKQLIENKNRREGPIVRFDESVFWQLVLENKVTGKNWDMDYFGASKITPFKANRTSGDSLLLKQFVQAQNLLLQYKNREKLVSEIFDINKLAQYYALIDVTQAYHGFTWHNQRFYYNPVTCLLEPIAFDGYIETGIYKRIDEQVTGLLNPQKIASLNRQDLMLFQVFSDSLFCEKYIQKLQEYSTPGFINKVIAETSVEADSISNLINREFPYYNFNYDRLNRQAEFIRNNIAWIEANTKNIGLAFNQIKQKSFQKEYTSEINKNIIPLQVNAYFNKEKKQVEIANFANNPVKILGAFMADRLPESFDKHPELKAYKGDTIPKITIPIDGKPLKILFSVKNQMYETGINQWPCPKGLTTRQITFAQANMAELPVIENKVVFDGNYQFESDVVIPSSLGVIFRPGTKLDLKNGAGFFSFSPVKMEGTESNPVEINSSDKTANGFNIIQAEGRSKLKHVRFNGLSSIQKGGWMTPSAVTFYEANVDFENCVFANNSNCDDALNVVRSDFSAINCHFENTFADAFDSDFCTGMVSECTFQKIGNDAIDFSGSQVTISKCKMMEISDKAISGGENSKLFVSNCEIKKANIGIASKDLSTLELDKILMEQTIYGIVAFVKKPEYGPASIKIDNLKMKNNMVFHQIEAGSVLTLNGKTIHGNEKNLATKLYQ